MKKMGRNQEMGNTNEYIYRGSQCTCIGYFTGKFCNKKTWVAFFNHSYRPSNVICQIGIRNVVGFWGKRLKEKLPNYTLNSTGVWKICHVGSIPQTLYMTCHIRN